MSASIRVGIRRRARLFQRLGTDVSHGDDVVAVDLHAGNAGGDRLLRQGFGGGLAWRAARRWPTGCC